MAKKLPGTASDINDPVTGSDGEVVQYRLATTDAGYACGHKPLQAADIPIELHDYPSLCTEFDGAIVPACETERR